MGQFIIRLGSREKIGEDYLEKQITFSCPANWYDYAIKKNNFIIGDQRECIYAHIPLDDPRISEQDCFGNSMGNNLAMLIDSRDNSVYLRHEPVLLTPAFCFFQINITNDDFVESETIKFDFESYCSMMQCKMEDCYFWIVYDAKSFEDDLKANIPPTIKANQDLLITDGSGGYVNAFDEKQPINYMPVDYNKHDFNSYFYEKNHRREEMWWKSSEYKEQNEGRIVIPSVHFSQRYSVTENYNWKKNLLKVKLPNLYNYSIVCDGTNPIYFSRDIKGNIEIKYVKVDLHL